MNAQKKMLLGGAFALLLFAGCGAQSAAPASSASSASSGAAAASSSASAKTAGSAATAKGAFSVAITFDYKRADTAASNQIAAWVEDKDGNVVKDLGATRFTATGGFERRKESLPLWVAKMHPADMKSDEVDAIAQATPQAGKQTITWDGTDNKGASVPDGAEGALNLWES